MQEFVLTIGIKDQECLGAIRCISGLKAAVDNMEIWIRGVQADSMEASAIKRLPVIKRFLVDSNGLLFPVGSITPTAVIKEMNWVALDEFIPLELPVAAAPGAATGLLIRLVPSGEIRKAAALVTSLAYWQKFGDIAPLVRLNRLKFAVSEMKDVLIVGDPLPSLPGREYWQNLNMLLPAGYDFEFPMLAPVIQEILGGQNSILLFEPDAGSQLIDPVFLLSATRSAIRLSGDNTQIW